MFKKSLRALVLAVTLTSMVGAPILVSSCASVQSIFQSDPVGASLKTIKDSYEAGVRTAGRLYLTGQITEVQLRSFRDEANRVYRAYTELATLHELNSLKAGDLRIEDLSRLLDVLLNMVAILSAQGVN